MGLSDSQFGSKGNSVKARSHCNVRLQCLFTHAHHIRTSYILCDFIHVVTAIAPTISEGYII